MVSRIEQLARAKPNHLRFPDRRSVYWLDELPPERTGSPTRFELTTRWSLLCGSKKLSHEFEQIRPSPEWQVSASALKACASRRVRSLALPRLPAAGWQPDRPLLAPLSREVQTAVASRRICQLSLPRRRRGSSPHGSGASLPAPPRPPAAAAASSRIQLLANPKPDHPDYALGRPVSWPVPGAAMEAVSSPRVRALALPRRRRAGGAPFPPGGGYDPYAVSPAARSASASPRLLELSLPLPRKRKGN